MDDNQLWHRRTLMEKAGKALEKNGFAVSLHDDADGARAHLLAAATTAQTIGFGGSMSVAALGIARDLEGEGKTLLVHSRAGLTSEERRRIMQEQLCCDLFLTGTNALTLQGQLVNIDATGNRVGAMAFGPKQVIIVAGANKIVADLETALRRVREVASPPNARRLGYNTPCAKTGICSDCDSPERICRITTILDRRPRVTEVQVCLVGADLGY
jgi:L-lactate utilization protein LutB